MKSSSMENESSRRMASELPASERERLEHLSRELEVQFDLDRMSLSEAEQLIGELEKRAAREGQEE